MQDTLYALLIISQTALLGCLVWLYLQHKKVTNLKKRVEFLQSDVAALSLGAVGVSRHIDSLSKKQQDFIKKQTMQQKNTTISPAAADTEKLYQSAIELVKKGASVDDIVSNCHLVREEAELIKMIHSSKVA